MKKPIHSYDKALVPEHLTKQTIESLPFEKAYYINPGERDDFEAPNVFVTPDRQLAVSKSYSFDMDDVYPHVPLELVGLMHVAVVDTERQTVKDVYLADLRFLAENSLVDIDPSGSDVDDQESYMSMVNYLDNIVTIDAFIAPEPGDEIEDGVVPGTFYGDPALYPHLKKLRKRGNKLMKQFMEREAAQAAKRAESAATTPTLEKPQASGDKTKKPAFLEDPFSSR